MIAPRSLPPATPAAAAVAMSNSITTPATLKSTNTVRCSASRTNPTGMIRTSGPWMNAANTRCYDPPTSDSGLYSTTRT